MQQTKIGLRRYARWRMRSRSITERMRCADRIYARIVATPLWKNSRLMCGYVPLWGEVDVTALNERAIREGKGVGLPPPDHRRQYILIDSIYAYHRYCQARATTRHALHLRPIENTTLADRPFLMLIPGLLFSPYGTRLGRGGGWYDRIIARYPNAVPIGMCPEKLLVGRLPREAHDLRCAYICTEHRFIRCMHRMEQNE